MDPEIEDIARGPAAGRGVTPPPAPAPARQALAMAVDRRYLPWALHLARQIDRLETQRRFDIFILSTEDVGPDVARHAPAARFVQITDPALLARLPHWGRFSRETGLRHLLPEVLGRDYDRLVYCDVDIWMHRAGLSDLFDTPMQGHAIMAVPDLKGWKLRKAPDDDAYFAGVGVPPERYLNAGVLLMDVQACLAAGTPARLLGQLARAEKNARAFDQTTLNKVMNAEIGRLSPIWNFQLMPVSATLVARFDPVLVHFVARKKPWHLGCSRDYYPYQLQYRAFLRDIGSDLPIPDHPPRPVRPRGPRSAWAWARRTLWMLWARRRVGRILAGQIRTGGVGTGGVGMADVPRIAGLRG